MKEVQKIVFGVHYKWFKVDLWHDGIAIGDDTGDVDIIFNPFTRKVEVEIWDYKPTPIYSSVIFDIKEVE